MLRFDYKFISLYHGVADVRRPLAWLPKYCGGPMSCVSKERCTLQVQMRKFRDCPKKLYKYMHQISQGTLRLQGALVWERSKGIYLIGI